MAEEDLILRASLKDDISKPIDQVASRVEDLGDAAEGAGKSAKEMGRQADSAGKSAEKMGRQVDTAGKSAGRADSRLSRLAKGGLSKVQTWAKRGLIGVAAFTTGVAALTAKKGLERLLGIEDAQAKLRGLGMTTQQVSKVMENSLAAVKGTAFGLQDAVTVAADASAVDVKPGQQMEDYLKVVTSAAIAAKKPLTDIGSIFNKVEGQGKLTGETLQQLTENGLGGVSAWMAKARGVSVAEFRKLVSEGAISADEFRKVVGVRLEAMAAESQGTTRTMASNVMASVGRIGAGFLAGIMPSVKSGLSGLLDYLGPVEEKAKRLGDTLGSKLANVDLAGMWKQAKPYLAAARDWFSELWASVKPVGPAFKEFGEAYGPVLVAILGGIVAAGAPVVDWLLNSIGPAIVTVLAFLTDNKDAVLTFVAIAGGALVLAAAVAKVKLAIVAFKAGMVALNLVMSANPIALIVIAIAALAAGLVWAYKNVDWFRTGVDKVWAVLKYLGAWIKNVLVGYLTVMGAMWLTVAMVALKAVRFMVNGILSYFGMLLAGAEKAFGWVPGIGDKIKGANRAFQSMRAKVDETLGGVEKKLKGARDKVIEFGKTNIKVPKLDLDTRSAKDKVRDLQGLINGMNGKTVRVAVQGGTGGGTTVGDTSTSRAAAGSRGNALARTFSAHNRINAQLGGRYMVSNALVGGGGRGRGSGDHQRGRALDVVGRNLPAYAQAVRDSGGYAAVHGTGGDKHVHAVMGDTVTSRSTSPVANGKSRTVVVQSGAVQIVVPDGDRETIKAAVKAALNDIERELEEVDG